MFADLIVQLITDIMMWTPEISRHYAIVKLIDTPYYNVIAVKSYEMSMKYRQNWITGQILIHDLIRMLYDYKYLIKIVVNVWC